MQKENLNIEEVNMAENKHQIIGPASPGEDFSRYCRDIPDFPKAGIVFRDITNLLKNGPVFKRAIDAIAACYSREKIDAVVCIEARGFIIGSALSYSLGCGLVPVRKKGKLPWKVYRQSYDLEYGQDHIEVHQDAIQSDQNVLIVDDVIATGGTVEAVAKLVKQMKGNIVGAAFLIELSDLKGREKIKGIPVMSLIKY
jgi:adenine phosphoribosyltransferase